jgi:hypothetical protein
LKVLDTSEEVLKATYYEEELFKRLYLSQQSSQCSGQNIGDEYYTSTLLTLLQFQNSSSNSSSSSSSGGTRGASPRGTMHIINRGSSEHPPVNNLNLLYDFDMENLAWKQSSLFSKDEFVPPLNNIKRVF